ncbi:hypothetical protein FACS189490_11080 [Clostridia bacterium]|nr:hypothetical protein FACS189490_11080 [Clostridia bacterium]
METAYGYLEKYVDTLDKTPGEYANHLGNILVVYAGYGGLLSDDELTHCIHARFELNKKAVAKPNVIFHTVPNYFKKVRVGLISYDFRYHSVGKFISSLYKYRSKNDEVEVYSYYTYAHLEDEITAIVKAESDMFRNVGGLSDTEIEKIILEDKLDILVDLGGHTLGTKVFAMAKRFAPVQASWIGFPMSTYVPNMDYLIGDYYINPPDDTTEEFMVEKVARMKPCYMCFVTKMEFEKADEPPCVKNRYVTFGNMSNPQKWSPKSLNLWKRVLDTVPNSKLLLRFNGANDENEVFMEKFNERLIRHGFDLDRVIIGKDRGQDGYYRTYDTIDIMLDTTPLSAWTTMVESMTMGVPTVTYKSKQMQGRAWTFLVQVGLSDLGGDTDEEYVRIASELANDVDRLKYLKKNLRQMAFDSPLFDEKIFRAAFENTMRQIYVHYCLEHKKPFDAGYYGRKSADKILRDCLRAAGVIEYLMSENEPSENIKLLAKELVEMVKILAERLIDAYETDTNALAVIQQIIHAAGLLKQAQSSEEILAIAKVINKLTENFD